MLFGVPRFPTAQAGRLAPVPSLMRKHLERLTNTEVLVIARYVVGGYTAKCVQHRWDAGISELCPLCPAVASKTHRLLHCPATAHVRDRWRQFFEPAIDEWPHWLHGPSPVLPADVEISNLVFATRRLVLGPYPCVTPLLQGLSRLRLFTDGSCRHPSVSWARVASSGLFWMFHVVTPIC